MPRPAPDLGLKNHRGVCETLRGEISYRDAVHKVAPAFDVMPAGRNRNMPLSAILSKSIDELFAWAREQYSYIVVDTAPLNYASESLVIAKYSDTAVLSLLRDVSRLEPTKNTVHNLRSVECRFSAVFSPASRRCSINTDTATITTTGELIIPGISRRKFQIRNS